MEGGGGDDTFPWHTRGAGAGDHLLSLRSRRSLSTTAAAITGEPVVDASSGHHVVEVQPRADDDNGDGSSTMCSPRPGPGVHLVLAFHDLTYSVKREGGRMKMLLLDGISGEAREGEMVAVLGASGAGKSTLIDALANRIQRGSLRGTVTLNGEALEGRLLRVISAYVMQEDQLHPMLTVTETMMYSAELRLPHSLSASAKRSRVHALIDQLGLGAAANTIIGDEAHRGVSGGERRRVSIGIDIVHNPIILFLDEPTSGLDSTIAFTVVKVLQRIARSGSVVIMSVHQPSHRIIGLLDRLLFLSRGRTVFYGPPSAMPLFFSELGQPIPEGENPAEFALDHIRELEMQDDDDGGGTEEDELGLLVQFNKSWQKNNNNKKTGTPPPMMSLEEAISLSLARGKLLVAADSMDMEVAAAGRSAVVVEVEAYANPPWVEIWILTRRGLTNMRRTKEQLLIRFGAVVLTAFVMATIFGRLDNTPKGVSERFSFFAIAMCTLFFTSADALPVFLLERYIFFRETAHNAYRRSSYTLSNAIVAFLPLLLLSVTFAGITFFSLGLAGGWEGFAFFVLVVLASFWAGSGFVTFVSGVVQHVIIGCAVVAALMCYFMLFSGFFVKRDRIAYYWIWFHYLSLMKYPYEAMMQNEFGADPEKCFMRGVQVFDGTLMGKLAVETQVTVLNAMSKSVGVHFDSSTCVTTGRDILAQQAVDQLGKWGCLWVTFASGFLFRLLFHLTLLLGTKNKRK